MGWVGWELLNSPVRLVPHRVGGDSVGNGDPHKIVRVDARMIAAAAYFAEGIPTKEIAKKFDVDETTVRAWKRNEKVQEEVVRILRADLVPMVAKAIKVVKKQMDSTKANGFLAQNAASLTLTKYGAPLLEEKTNELEVVFTNGLIPIGMPEDTSAEADDLTET